MNYGVKWQKNQLQLECQQIKELLAQLQQVV